MTNPTSISYELTPSDRSFMFSHSNNFGGVKDEDLRCYIIAYHEYDHETCIQAWGHEYSLFYDAYSLWNDAIKFSEKGKRALAEDVRYHVEWLKGNFGETEDKMADALLNYFNYLNFNKPETKECSTCLGTGMDNHDPRRPCSICDGEGVVPL